MNYTTHCVKVNAVCPVDGVTVDEYEMDIEVPDGMVLYAEAITKAVDISTEHPVTQEQLTQRLADFLHSPVVSRGKHAGGRVETVCRRDPQPPVSVKPEDIK